MAFLGKKDLSLLITEESGIISPFDSNRIKEAAYELCLGNEVYLTDSTTKKKERLDEKNCQAVVKPGQFALLLTRETVDIPLDKLAFISIKFSQKIKGLINVSGFHVDPGFKGKIIFSVYNAGPSAIVLEKDEPYFMIWFSELKGESTQYKGQHQNQDKIDAKIIESLGGDLASPNVLLERIKSNESSLTNTKWFAGIVVSLCVAIASKFAIDNSKLNEGYLLGAKEREAKFEVNEAFRTINIDSLVSARVDRILRSKNDKKNGAQ